MSASNPSQWAGVWRAFVSSRLLVSIKPSFNVGHMWVTFWLGEGRMVNYGEDCGTRKCVRHWCLSVSKYLTLLNRRKLYSAFFSLPHPPPRLPAHYRECRRFCYIILHHNWDSADSSAASFSIIICAGGSGEEDWDVGRCVCKVVIQSGSVYST